MIERSSQHQITFESDMGNRVLLAIFSAAFVGLAYASVGRLLGWWMVREFPLILALVSVPFYLTLATVCWMGSGPRKITIDLANSTYVLIQGSPGFPKTWQGKLTDFSCVCVEGRVTGSSTTAIVVLRRSAPGPKMLRVIGGMLKRPEAEIRAKDLSERTGIAYEARC